MKLKSDVVVFTDGASRGNPGPGGFAAVIIMPQNRRLPTANSQQPTVTEIGGREERTTNNRMELRAAIEALSFLESYQLSAKSYKLIVYTDSSYLVNGITKWIHGWRKNGWKTKAKQDVENKDLWEALVEVARGKEIEWKLVGGHIGIAGNQRCDEIATAFADGKTPKLYADVLENYSIKNILEVPQGRTLGSEKGSTLKKRSRAVTYSYVSLVDGKIQTHKTWAECGARVTGKAGAKYKKVFSAEEEQELVALWGGK